MKLAKPNLSSEIANKLSIEAVEQETSAAKYILQKIGPKFHTNEFS